MTELFTSQYQRFDPASGLPIRTTVGRPRFRLPYTLIEDLDGLTPDRRWLSLGYEPYRDVYRQMLDQHTAPRLQAGFTVIAERYGDHRLVFLCFDDLTKPGGIPADVWCHRMIFAEWWLEQTGVIVPELTVPGRTSSKDPSWRQEPLREFD